MDYVLNLDIETFTMAFSAVEIIKRRDNLVDLRIADYPSRAENDRRKMHESFYKSAFPGQKEKVLTTRDLMLNKGLLNNV